MSDGTIFHANDEHAAYFVCARDLEHAKQILHDAEVQLHDPAGVRRAVHHEAVCHPTMWMEIDEQRARTVTPHGSKPLTDFRLGEWCRVLQRKR